MVCKSLSSSLVKGTSPTIGLLIEKFLTQKHVDEGIMFLHSAEIYQLS